MFEIFRLFFAVAVLFLSVLAVNLGFETMDQTQLARANVLFDRLGDKNSFAVVVNGGYFSLEQVSSDMRYQMYYARKRFNTVEEFVEYFASKPSIDGKAPQLVKRTTSELSDFSTMLVSMLDNIDRTTVPDYSAYSKKYF